MELSEAISSIQMNQRILRETWERLFTISANTLKGFLLNVNERVSTKIEESIDKRSNSIEFTKPANLYANRNSVIETKHSAQRSSGSKESFMDKISFPIKNKDTGEVLDLQTADHELDKNIKSDLYSKLKRRQHLIWKDWWAQKRNINHDFLEAIKRNNFKLCLTCLDPKKKDLKADLNFRDEKNNSPLHYACLSGNYDIVLLILKNEADLEITNAKGQTPLVVTASM